MNFQKLFYTNNQNYTLATVSKTESDKQELSYITKTGEVNTDLYQRHLDGKEILGISPMLKDGTAYLGMIDIDNHQIIENFTKNHLLNNKTTIHNELDRLITKLNLPLTVCKSKSGAVHLFIFFNEPIQAELIISKLSNFCIKLGYTQKQVEDFDIYPTKNKPLNLPYNPTTCQKAIVGNNSLYLNDGIEVFKKRRISLEQLLTIEDIEVDINPSITEFIKNIRIVRVVEELNPVYTFEVFYKNNLFNWTKSQLLNQNFVITELACVLQIMFTPVKMSKFSNLILQEVIKAKKRTLDFEMTVNNDFIEIIYNMARESTTDPINFEIVQQRLHKDLLQFTLPKLKKLLKINNFSIPTAKYLEDLLIKNKIYKKRVITDGEKKRSRIYSINLPDYILKELKEPEDRI